MSSARRLLLHIGFPKTGSSAIQAWLARRAPELERHGIAYRNFHDDDAEDKIGSGNGKMLFGLFRADAPAFTTLSRKFEQDFIPDYFAGFDTAIVSHEGLAGASESRLNWFREYCARQRIAVSALGYCRTIYDHCHSMYQQEVKRHGATGRFSDYAATYDNPQCGYLWTWRAVLGGALNARIYDAAKNDLIADFLRQFGIDRLGLGTEQGKVNRGLTARELELLRRLNAWHKGAFSKCLSNALIYASPDQPSDYRFDRAIAEDLERRFGDDVRKVNAALFSGAAEKLVVSRPIDPGSAGVTQQEPDIELDPMVEIAFKALSEAAAAAKAGETSLRRRFALERAKAAMAAENWSVAARLLQRALLVDPDDATAHRRLAEAFTKLGDHQAAKAHRQAAIQLRDRAAADSERDTIIAAKQAPPKTGNP